MQPWKLTVRGQGNRLEIDLKAAFPWARKFFQISLRLKLSQVSSPVSFSAADAVISHQPKSPVSHKILKSCKGIIQKCRGIGRRRKGSSSSGRNNGTWHNHLVDGNRRGGSGWVWNRIMDKVKQVGPRRLRMAFLVLLIAVLHLSVFHTVITH